MVETGCGIDAVMLNASDNVATALREVAEGEEVRVGVGERVLRLRATQAIAFGHKLAVEAIERGAMVRKYGEVIGRATRDIPAGAHAHIHNVESLRGRGDLETTGKPDGV